MVWENESLSEGVVIPGPVFFDGACFIVSYESFSHGEGVAFHSFGPGVHCTMVQFT